MLAAVNRFIVFAVLAGIGLLLWMNARTEVGIAGHSLTLVEKLSGVTGAILMVSCVPVFDCLTRTASPRDASPVVPRHARVKS